jgi:hypothetical protein
MNTIQKRLVSMLLGLGIMSVSLSAVGAKVLVYVDNKNTPDYPIDIEVTFTPSSYSHMRDEPQGGPTIKSGSKTGHVLIDMTAGDEQSGILTIKHGDREAEVLVYYDGKGGRYDFSLQSNSLYCKIDIPESATINAPMGGVTTITISSCS